MIFLISTWPSKLLPLHNHLFVVSIYTAWSAAARSVTPENNNWTNSKTRDLQVHNSLLTSQYQSTCRKVNEPPQTSVGSRVSQTMTQTSQLNNGMFTSTTKQNIGLLCTRWCYLNKVFTNNSTTDRKPHTHLDLRAIILRLFVLNIQFSSEDINIHVYRTFRSKNMNLINKKFVHLRKHK